MKELIKSLTASIKIKGFRLVVNFLAANNRFIEGQTSPTCHLPPPSSSLFPALSLRFVRGSDSFGIKPFTKIPES